MIRTANCNCGDLTIRVEGDPEFVAVCYCEFCQRRTGSVLGVSAYFTDAQVLEIKGATTCYERKQDGDRMLYYYFCPRCSGGTHWTTEWHAGHTGISAGAFFDSEFPKPERAVMTKHAQPWLTLAPDIQTIEDANNN
jgi:hypothetical protein